MPKKYVVYVHDELGIIISFETNDKSEAEAYAECVEGHVYVRMNKKDKTLSTISGRIHTAVTKYMDKKKRHIEISTPEKEVQKS